VTRWPRQLPEWLRGVWRLGAPAAGYTGLGVLSLALAVLLWAAVTRSIENPDTTKIIEVRLTADGIPRNYLATGISPETVQVTLTGKRNRLKELKTEDVVARVDLSAADEGSETQEEYTLEGKVQVRVPGDVHADSDISTARVRLERQERQEVRVQVKTIGGAGLGWEFDSATVDDQTVTVSGSRRNLLAVEGVYADVDLSGLTVNVSRPVALQARDRDGRTVGGVTVDPSTTTVSVKLHQLATQKTVAVSVVVRGTPKVGYTETSIRSDPAQVTVVGPVDQLNILGGVLTDAVDIDGADRDVSRSVQLQVPPKVTVLGQQSVVVTIALQQVRSSASVPAFPRVINVDPRLVAQLNTPILALAVIGPLADVVQLRATSVNVTVDASGLTQPGTYKLDPKVTLPPSVQLDGVVPDKVEVILTPAR
jgi:YbbR domain-containing protein